MKDEDSKMKAGEQEKGKKEQKIKLIKKKTNIYLYLQLQWNVLAGFILLPDFFSLAAGPPGAWLHAPATWPLGDAPESTTKTTKVICIKQ